MRRRVIDPAGRRTSVEHRRPSLSVLSLGDLSIGQSRSLSQESGSKFYLCFILFNTIAPLNLRVRSIWYKLGDYTVCIIQYNDVC